VTARRGRRAAAPPFLAGLAGLASPALFGACARGEEPLSWLSLERGWTPERAESTSGAGSASPRLVRRESGEWLEIDLSRADWVYKERLGVWGAEVPARGAGLRPEGDPQTLEAPGKRYTYLPPTRLGPAIEGERPPDDTFLHTAGGLFLVAPIGEEPPPELVLSLWAGRGRAEDAGSWRVEGTRFTGDGLAVRPGERTRVEVPASSVDASLTFAACLEPAWEREEEGARVTFALEVDGERRWSLDVAPWEEHASWHRVALPRSSAPRRVDFVVEGSVAFTSFLVPRVAPADRARPAGGVRPGSEPDVVVFLADTFRADNLELDVDGAPLLPNLRELAAESRLFEQARSTSTYTFPAHASLFTSLYPRTVGAIGATMVMPEQPLTLAEHLRRHGYRTGAVTDSAMVSARYGLAQGFEYFDESLVSLASTLERARAFLAADDGRPTFLFVHTYRAHTPFLVGDEIRERLGGRLELEGEFATLERRRLALERAREGPVGEEERRLVEHLHDLYRGGAADLDREIGPFLDELRERRLLAQGLLVFTSDHGEAFLEHGDVYHTGEVFEEQLRVPLLLAGRGITPGREARPVSLLDVAPTVAEAAGLPVPDGWLGRSLLGPPPERLLFAFQCWGEPKESTLAVFDGPRKLIASEAAPELEAGGLRGAYALDADPGETVDRRDEAWVEELLRRARPVIAPLREPRYEVQTLEPGGVELRQLQKLGYAEALDRPR